MTERLQISGYNPSDAPVDWECNSTGQSGLVDLKNGNILLVREVGYKFNGVMGEDQEIVRRTDAIRVHTHKLPEFTLDYYPVVLQGFKYSDEHTEPIKVFAKMTEKLNEVRELKEMNADEILSDGELCDDLSRLFLGQLKLFIFMDRYYDNFGFGEIGSNWNRLNRVLFRPMQPNNTMVGYDKEGNQRLFVDPDWYLTGEELKHKIQRLASEGKKHTSIFRLHYNLIKSALFYKLASTYEQINEWLIHK